MRLAEGKGCPFGAPSALSDNIVLLRERISQEEKGSEGSKGSKGSEGCGGALRAHYKRGAEGAHLPSGSDTLYHPSEPARKAKPIPG